MSHSSFYLITGATQGIGEACARALAAQGATVILLGRRKKKLIAVYDDLVAQGFPEPIAIEFDFLTAQDADHQKLAFELSKMVPKLDGIVHCASHFYALSPLVQQTIDEWMNQYKINTVSPLALTRALLPLLREASDPSVLFFGDNHGPEPKAYWGGFGASKAGIHYVLAVAHAEWGSFLRLNLVIPGAIDSPERTKTHPGEAKQERNSISCWMPTFLHVLSAQGPKGSTIERPIV
jgi:NAD(P)-dependent dehydrogenase (short-subunit alcohol dehydrogenase family)